MAGVSAATGPAARWDGNTLVSDRFGDVYASRAGARAQAEAVFLPGCGLPEAWAGRRRFTLAETGFGTGTSLMAALDLWRRTRPCGATLHLFSVEAFPLPAADAARALERAGLADLARPLLARWPEAKGWHRIDWPALGASLDLAIGDAAEELARWQGAADAWFLDGFAPARNPAMWSPALIALVRARSAPGARLASWCVAGPVRRALEAEGFAVARRPGFAGKRQRLEARLPGTAADPPAPTVAIVGAGIAGVSLARAFAGIGVPARLLAAGPSASTNPAALVTPRLEAGSPVAARLHAQAFRRAVALIETTAPEAIVARRVERQLGPAEIARAEATIASGHHQPGSLAPGASAEAPALWLRDALVVDPARLLATWAPPAEPSAVAALEADGARWRLLDPAGQMLAEADIVCLAAGPANTRLAPVRLAPVRGQVTLVEAAPPPVPLAGGAYAIPTPQGGTLVGATHQRDDLCDTPRAEDDEANLARLARQQPDLARRLAAAPRRGIAGIRAASPDRQPLAGQLADGLFLLGGLGGRGFTLAPLLAEHVAALVAGVPSPLPADATALVDPRRPAVAARAQGVAQGGRANPSAR
ncbi:MAG: tRNA (5-methylaminomethyl-2-thiouridine)(34)-methyltransferase MnmD [Sphingomonadaceae bacterium]